ncbi:hypothetical protein RJT34_03034 [Clitoria ternatea]|uniref:Transmembrane protein n=1 Tax=Clitoria ternatea TaxID=43366 RepID=A0AAN9PZF1_CLITE
MFHLLRSVPKTSVGSCIGVRVAPFVKGSCRCPPGNGVWRKVAYALGFIGNPFLSLIFLDFLLWLVGFTTIVSFSISLCCVFFWIYVGFCGWGLGFGWVVVAVSVGGGSGYGGGDGMDGSLRLCVGG